MPEDSKLPVPVSLASGELSGMSKNERLKVESEGLYWVASSGERHSFGDEVEQPAQGERETLSNEAKEISKFFGIYKQQIRGERGRKTHDYVFMVRIKSPAGGSYDARRWAALDEAAERFADGTIRITSRQGIQFHHVRGAGLGPLVRHLNRSYRPGATLGACGDVSRNVMCSRVEGLDPEHATGGRELALALVGVLPGLRVGRHRPERGADQLRRADLRPPLPAAQVQDRHRAPVGQLGRRADAGRRLRPGPERRRPRRLAVGSLRRRRSRAHA